MKLAEGPQVKWMVGVAFIAMVMVLGSLTFLVTPQTERSRRPVDDTEEALVALTNEVKILRETLDRLSVSSLTEQPVGFTGRLPPRWERMTLRLFLEKFNFGCRNFDNLIFENVDFSGLNLVGVSFIGSTFRFCSFERTALSANFGEATLVNARFDRSTFQYPTTSFRKATLENCTFDLTQARDAKINFENSRIRSVSFKSFPSNLEFTNADISGVYLEYRFSAEWGRNSISFANSTLTDITLVPFPATSELDFKSVFCGTRSLSRVNLAGAKIRLLFKDGVNPDWNGCLVDSTSKMTISASNFRNVVIVTPQYLPAPQRTLKEYLSQIAILDDKCEF